MNEKLILQMLTKLESIMHTLNTSEVQILGVDIEDTQQLESLARNQIKAIKQEYLA